MVTLTDAEWNQILAALRYWQESHHFFKGIPYEFIEIATNGGKYDPMNHQQINHICDRINTRE